ncbi:MAG: sirohydrochlorin cobaltochelatase [Prevotella sp.]|nr:sirohydrochlorin cobaltochelatase [Prevotella sp.]
MMVLCTASVCAQDLVSEQALLMVHFGTTYDDTRQKTIDAINEKARQTFKGWQVREAYSSPRVMKRLAERGIRKDAPVDALLRLRGEGCRRVIVLPSFVIDGREMDMLRSEVDRVRPFFDSISVCTPLLYSAADCERVCRILVNRHPASKAKREHVLFVGHGTEGPATALYSQLDYMLKADGHDNYHVATIEGYPTQDTAIRELKARKARRVTLVPLLFVAGDHASNDIKVDWKEELERQGFSVAVSLEGLGEVPEIQDLYIKKIKQ